MDLSFTMRVRKPRLRDRVATRDLPLLFARLATEQSASATAVAQTALDRTAPDDGRDAWSPFAQRVAIFTGTMPVARRATCPSFAVIQPAPAKMKPAFTVALQASFKPTVVGIGASIEPPGAGGAGSRSQHD